MTISYLLAPIPKWYLVDNYGEPLAGGKMYTYSNLNKTQPKVVYQDPAGSLAYTNPVIFDANGTEGPFYWKTDSANTNDTYYIRVYDSDDNFMYDIENYFPPGGSGGGSTTTYVTLNNFIINNVFWRNIGTSATPVPTTLTLAPSAHSAFLTPDLTFVKNSTANSDTISFPSFALGDDPFTGDVTPNWYMNYECTTSIAGETEKYIQFPIESKVNNLDNQTVTFTLWARCNSGNPNLTVYLNQFFGSGGSPSPDQGFATAQSIPLTASWTKYELTFVVPNTSGKTLGTCGDDGLYLRIQFPLSLATNIDLAKPSLYLGDISPSDDFDTYDMVDSVINAPRTGDFVTALGNSRLGYIAMDDGTIGNNIVGTGSSNATNRSNSDTFFLYKLIWDQTNASAATQAYAPIYDSSGTPTTRGATAVEDFDALKALSLTRSLARVMAGTTTQTSLTFTANAGTDLLTVSSTNSLLTGNPVQLINSGGALPSPLLAGVTYYCIRVSSTTLKLATSYDNAIAGTAIDLTDAGTGTQTIKSPPYLIGQPIGEELHTLTISEMPAHTHPGSTVYADDQSGGTSGTLREGFNSPPTTTVSVSIASQGGGAGHNTIQPTTFYNVFVKL